MKKNMKGSIVVNVKEYPNIYLEGLKKATIVLKWEISLFEQIFEVGQHEYKDGGVTTRLGRPVTQSSSVR
jgi:hypothetical protein